MFQRLVPILAMLLGLAILSACDEDEPEYRIPRPTPTPTELPWQVPQETIQLENAPQIELLGRLDGHSTTIIDLKFSKDSVFLATGSTADARVRVWNLSSGRPVLRLDNLSPVNFFFSPENETFVTLNLDRQLQEWTLFDEELLATFEAQNAQIGPSDQTEDQTKIAIAGAKGFVHMFSLNPLTDLGMIEAHPIIPVNHVEFTPDGKRLVTAATSSGSIKLWDVDSQELIHDFGDLVPEPAQIGITPDGESLVVTTTIDIRVWSMDDFELRQVIPVQQQTAVGHIGFANDGTVLTTYGRGGEIWLWNLRTEQALVRLPGHMQPIRGAIYSPDEQMLLSATGGTNLFLWDLSVLDRVTTPTEEILVPRSQIAPPGVDIDKIAWSPDGQRIVFTDPTGRIYILGVLGND